MPGYGARRCQVVLQKALEFEPSLIIMHVNDTNKWEDEREWRRSQEFKGWHPRHWLMKVFIFRRLFEAKLEKVFWPLVPDQIRLKYAVSDADAQVAASKDPEEIAARIRLAQETMVENVALVRRSNIPLLVDLPVPAGERRRAAPLSHRPWPGGHVRGPQRAGGLSPLHAGGLQRSGLCLVLCRQRPLEEPGAPAAGRGHLPGRF